MSHQQEAPAKRRHHFFWWTLINLLALAFAVGSWVGCYSVFNFPERPRNYKWLQKLDRLPEISFFKGSELPKAKGTLPPQQLYGLIYERSNSSGSPQLMDGETLQTLNTQLKRNYITNFKSPTNLNYVRGTWRILSIRELNEKDFIKDGFAVLARALAVPADQENATNPELLPYPVEIEIILPTAKDTIIPPETQITADNSFGLDRLRSGLIILHLARTGTVEEPITRITTVPLLAKPFSLTEDTKVPLQIPSQVNPASVFPLFPKEAVEETEAPAE